MLRLGGAFLGSSCFGDPTWKVFRGFPRETCWSGLENLAITYYGLFARIFNQRAPLDTIFHLTPRIVVGFQALSVGAWKPSLCWGWAYCLSREQRPRALGLAVGQDYGHVPWRCGPNSGEFSKKALRCTLSPLKTVFIILHKENKVCFVFFSSLQTPSWSLSSEILPSRPGRREMPSWWFLIGNCSGG